MEIRLVLVAPANQKRILSVALPAVVGRGPDATLRIAQESVSRRHCELFATDGAVFLRDLGSTNGTRVGAERITANAAIAVEPGSVVKVGEAAFRVEYERAATPVRPPVAAPAAPAAAVDDVDIPDLPLPDATEPAPDLVEDLSLETAAAAVADVPPPPPPDAFPSPTEAVEEPATGFDFGAVDAPPPLSPDAFPLPTDAVEEPAAAFDFIVPDPPPAAGADASLDDFLKGLQ